MNRTLWKTTLLVATLILAVILFASARKGDWAMSALMTTAIGVLVVMGLDRLPLDGDGLAV